MTTQRKPLVLDIECFANYLLIAMGRVNDDGSVAPVFMVEGVGEDARLTDEDISRLETLFTKPNLSFYTFNGRKYDFPVISAAMAGFTVSKCRRFSDYLVERTGGLADTGDTFSAMRKWGVTPTKVVDHIDMMDVTPGMASLKAYAARVDHDRIQDLPVSGAKSDPLTATEIDLVRSYCRNDLEMTAAVFRKLGAAFAVRREVGERYGVNVMSRSDAQIAEEVVLSEMGAKDKEAREEAKGRSVWPGAVPYAPPAWLEVHHPRTQALLAAAQGDEFKLIKGKLTPPAEYHALRDVVIGDVAYRCGEGGLHSNEKARSIVCEEGRKLVEYDVASYYPSLILRMGVSPPQFGDKFKDVYRSLVERRLKAKRDGDRATADVLKIAVNGVFGKLSSEYSPLRYPEALLKTTLTGQFALLMLIERLEAEGVRVVSANTDGVLMDARNDQAKTLKEVVAQWQSDTGLSGEFSVWDECFSESVNSYFMVNKSTGDVKCKGRFAPNALAKSPWAPVLQDAFIKWRIDGTAPADHINDVLDLRKFYFVRGVNVKPDVSDGDYGAGWRGEKLGRVARWVWVNEGGEPIIDLVSGRKVPMSDGAEPVMDHDACAVPVMSRLDRPRYVREFTKLAAACGMDMEQGGLL